MKLWTNGIIHSLDEHKYNNILTHQGKILGLNVDETQAFDEVIDLRGRHLYPGFTDAHLHLIGYGQYLSRVSVAHLKTKNDILDFLKTLSINDNLIVDGYQESIQLTQHDLDLVSSIKPIILRHTDFHAVTVNTCVLKDLNLHNPLGILREDESNLVLKTYTKGSNEILETYLEQAIKTLYRLGVTGGHSDDLYYFNGYTDTLNVFKKVLHNYPFRAHLLIHHAVLDDYLNDQNKPINHPYLELKGVKVFYDGTLFSKTALMKDGYQNQSSNGLRTSPNFIEIVKKVRHHKLTLAIHVIGDQGLEEVIDILQKYPPQKNQKDRIIHAPWVSEYGMNRLKTIPVTLDVQPQFLTSDLPEALTILNQPSTYIFPWKTMIKNGLIVSFSSDAPVEVPNPLLGMLDATERVLKNGSVFGPKEKLTRKEALKAYTTYANAQSDIKKGKIELGYVADFTILEKDLESIPSPDFKEELVFMTVINEHIVYQK